MKVRDLLGEIESCRGEFGEEFLDWAVYTEQCNEEDKEYKRTEQKMNILGDSENWEYFECCGFWTKFPIEKVFTINVNF